MTTTGKPMPIWDGKRGTCERFGFGVTYLDGLIDDRKVVARQLTPGSRTSKVIVNQPSVADHIEGLPVAKIAPPIPPEKRGRSRANKVPA